MDVDQQQFQRNGQTTTRTASCTGSPSGSAAPDLYALSHCTVVETIFFPSLWVFKLLSSSAVRLFRSPFRVRRPREQCVDTIHPLMYPLRHLLWSIRILFHPMTPSKDCLPRCCRIEDTSKPSVNERTAYNRRRWQRVPSAHADRQDMHSRMQLHQRSTKTVWSVGGVFDVLRPIGF